MSRIPLLEQRLTHSVIGAFFEVYNTLGFGFLEHVYVMALERELLGRGHRVGREVSVHVTYKGHVIGVQRIDMIVDEKLVVESKSTVELHKAAQRQVFNYLRATKLEVGPIALWTGASFLPFALQERRRSFRLIRCIRRIRSDL